MNLPDERPARRRCGHTSVPHTADLRIEAWGPTREDCIAEAVRGLVESFADVNQATHQRVIERHLDAGSDADLLASGSVRRCFSDRIARDKPVMTSTPPSIPVPRRTPPLAPPALTIGGRHDYAGEASPSVPSSAIPPFSPAGPGQHQSRDGAAVSRPPGK